MPALNQNYNPAEDAARLVRRIETALDAASRIVESYDPRSPAASQLCVAEVETALGGARSDERELRRRLIFQAELERDRARLRVVYAKRKAKAAAKKATISTTGETEP